MFQWRAGPRHAPGDSSRSWTAVVSAVTCPGDLTAPQRVQYALNMTLYILRRPQFNRLYEKVFEIYIDLLALCRDVSMSAMSHKTFHKCLIIAFCWTCMLSNRRTSQLRFFWQVFREQAHDTKLLVATGPAAVMLAFRGTASAPGCMADVQAWQASHPRQPESATWPSLVHNGFLKVNDAVTRFTSGTSPGFAHGIRHLLTSLP